MNSSEKDLAAVGSGFLAESLSLRDIRRALIRARLLIVLAVAVCEISAATYLVTAQPRYVVDMTLAPQQSGQPQSNAAGSLLGGQGGALGMAGSLLGLGGGGVNSDFEKFRVLYISPQTAAVVDQRLHLLRRIEPGWNEQTDRWEMPSWSLTNTLPRLVRLMFGRPVWRAPSPADLATYLANQIVIVKNDENPFLTVSSAASDPKQMEIIMAGLAEAANEILRRHAQEQAVEQIRYLGGELGVVSNADHRQVLTQLLSAQEQSLMLSRSKLPYAAQTLNPPTTHYDQVKPGIMVTLLLAGIVGLFVGIFACFIREASARGRGEETRDFGDVLWRRRRSRSASASSPQLG